MATVLINITHGAEHPTRAAFGFLIGRAAAEAGHDVTMFLVGDAVQLLREPLLDNVVGVGIGSLREHHDALRSAGATFYASKMSSEARGLEFEGVAEVGTPAKLVELSLAADRVLTY